MPRADGRVPQQGVRRGGLGEAGHLRRVDGVALLWASGPGKTPREFPPRLFIKLMCPYVSLSTYGQLYPCP
eukprot:5033519-Prymnesium_polylepis.1